MKTDALRPAQRFAVAAIEVCDRIHARGDQVTIRWVPSHVGVEGNEIADRYAKAAAGQSAPCQDEATPDELLDVASLSYMTRTATEARSRATVERITDHGRAERRYRPPRVEARAVGSWEARGRSWLGGSTSSCPDTQTSGPSFTG